MDTKHPQSITRLWAARGWVNATPVVILNLFLYSLCPGWYVSSGLILTKVWGRPETVPKLHSSRCSPWILYTTVAHAPRSCSEEDPRLGVANFYFFICFYFVCLFCVRVFDVLVTDTFLVLFIRCRYLTLFFVFSFHFRLGWCHRTWNSSCRYTTGLHRCCRAVMARPSTPHLPRLWGKSRVLSPIFF